MLLNQPVFRWIHKLMDQFDTPILCIRLGPSTHVIVVSSPDLACEFLKKQDEIFISKPDVMSAYLISDGYLTTAMSPFGEQWRKMKRVINRKMLSSPIHKWLQPKRDEEADKLLWYICKQINKQNPGDLINVRSVSQHFCGNMIRNMIFGTRLFGQGTEDGGPGDEETEHDALIDERIQMWNNGARKGKCDLLDVLINLEYPNLTPEEIKAQIIELMLATIDNPANTIEWTIGEMINEPTILKRAAEELDHVVGRDKLVQELDLSKLNYLKACIKEAFRLHPFTPFVPPHVSIEDTTVGGYFIPKGSHVLLSRFGLGRNPNVWTDPLRFDPDRHLRGERKQVVLTDEELRMLPFSTGKRGCPGMMLGMTMTTMLLARMVQGFTWHAPYTEQRVDLVENHDDLFLAKPLLAIAKPRLPSYMYPKY
ncbi:hypothetical protein QVD17_39121 [Tagetes erecta]|uniref:Cytochrome P450 n=1 Tax=Tagetes erecta TaxID=13708 RepID=A0AAD8N9Y3_TARER|nr:hypothetical protein QVD17_39121 [Tagetes erecta]